MGGKRVGDYLLSAPKRLLVAFAFTFAIAASSVDAASGDYPADPSADVPWHYSEWAPGDIQTIMNKFNAARAQDPTISVDLVIEYTQDQWDALSDNEKGLYLSNKERIDRGIAPYAAVARQVSDVAEDYATYLLQVEQTLAHVTTQARWTGSGRSSSSCCDPYDRLAAALGSQKEFFTFSENLAWTSTGSTSAFPEPIAWSVYSWIYDDSGSAWGHRHFSLAELSDNAGDAGAEGLAGFGVARGSGGTYVVMNVADEAAGWDYSTADNLILWSSMVGGNSGDPRERRPPREQSVAVAVHERGDRGSARRHQRDWERWLARRDRHLLRHPTDRVRDVAARAVRSRGWFRARFQSHRRRGEISRRVRSAAIVAEVQLPHTARARGGGTTTWLLRAVSRRQRRRKGQGETGARQRVDVEKGETKEAGGGGLFGLFRGGKDAEKDKAKEARGGGLFGRARV